MSNVNFVNFVKDCRIADRKLTMASCDIIFTRCDWEDGEVEGKKGKARGDGRMKLKEFLEALARCGRVQWCVGGSADGPGWRTRV